MLDGDLLVEKDFENGILEWKVQAEPSDDIEENDEDILENF